MRMPEPGGKVGHAELQVGTGLVMLADEFPDRDIRGPKAFGGSGVIVSVYVDDVDAVFERALAEGARELRPPTDEFYGDRTASFEDPYGHRWSIATHVEDVSPDEMRRRAEAAAQT
jgi:PhnB protein